jgi:hypothetical protein
MKSSPNADHVYDAAVILVERYGLDGKAPRSLAEVAEKHGMTRLAVRQVESRVLASLKKAVKNGAGATRRETEMRATHRARCHPSVANPRSASDLGGHHQS